MPSKHFHDQTRHDRTPQNRTRHERMMLAVFVAVTWWAVLEAWRPWNSQLPAQVAAQDSAARYASAQNAARESLAIGERVPYYRWLASGNRAYLAESPRPLPLVVTPEGPYASPWPLKTGPSFEAKTWWDEGGTTPLVFSFPAADLLPALDRAVLDTMAQWRGESWRLASYDTLAGWHEVGGAFARWSRPVGLPSQREIASQRIASPPTLLRPLLLTHPSQRLAMLPPQPTILPASDEEQNWQEEMIEVVRPYCADQLDQTVRTSIFAEPTSLVAQLQRLLREPGCRSWAVESLQVLGRLTAEEPPRWQSTGQLLEEFARLSSVAEELASEAGDPGRATRLRRARYAMWRRVECWQSAYSLIAPNVEGLSLATARDRGTVDPVSVAKVLALVESYESSGRPSEAQAVAEQITRLAASPDARRRVMGESMQAHYRNANARLAITSDLLQRFLPTESPQTERVSDRVLGTPIRGHATTISRQSVALVPDPHAWRINLLLEGEATSQTIAFERSVRVNTIGSTQFWAQQQILFDGNCLHRGLVTANATSHSQYAGSASKYDPLPLVGGFIRSKAASAFSERRCRAQREVAAKTANRVEWKMDAAVAKAIAMAEGQFQTRVTDRLAGSGVAIEPIELRTTSERLIARLRIAQEEGLTAHTPRPRAPSDSFASFQLHQSGLTNIAAGLELAGKRLSTKELVDRFAQLSPGRKALEPSEEATIEFAKKNPLVFQLKEDRVELTLSVSELVVRRRSNRDFKVHVYYKAEADGLGARFVHAEGPYFEGRLKNSERMRLQTIFGKVFPPNSDLVLGGAYADDPRLQGLMITQLVIDDGWLSVALGPERHLRSAQLDRYAPLR